MLLKSISPLAAVTGLASAAGLIRDTIPTSVDGSQYNSPTAGPPSSWFAGDPSLPISEIVSAAASMTKVPKDASYVLGNDNSKKATIYSDWATFSKVSIAGEREREKIHKRKQAVISNMGVLGRCLRICCRYGCRL